MVVCKPKCQCTRVIDRGVERAVRTSCAWSSMAVWLCWMSSLSNMCPNVQKNSHAMSLTRGL